VGLDETVSAPAGRRLVAGIGFRRGADASEIVASIDEALAAAGATPAALIAIATALDRAGEPAIRAAAAGFGLAPTGIDAAALAACDGRVETRSPRIEALRGVGSLCEAAALAAAGPGGRLVQPRIAGPSVTCALAFVGESRDRLPE
jgi:cobalt-precorrin 5A hydrolase